MSFSYRHFACFQYFAVSHRLFVFALLVQVCQWGKPAAKFYVKGNSSYFPTNGSIGTYWVPTMCKKEEMGFILTILIWGTWPHVGMSGLREFLLFLYVFLLYALYFLWQVINVELDTWVIKHYCRAGNYMAYLPQSILRHKFFSLSSAQPSVW